MLTNLDGIFIIKWQFPACVILYRQDSKILRQEFQSEQEAHKFCSINGITIQERIGKGWNARINGTMPSV